MSYIRATRGEREKSLAPKVMIIINVVDLIVIGTGDGSQGANASKIVFCNQADSVYLSMLIGHHAL